MKKNIVKSWCAKKSSSKDCGRLSRCQISTVFNELENILDLIEFVHSWFDEISEKIVKILN